MKIKNIFQICGALLFGAMMLASCSDDKSYDFDGYDYTRIYFNNALSLNSGSVVNTPVGVFASLSGNFIAKATAPVKQTTKAVLAVDASQVDAYNKAHSTEYKPLPDGVLQFSKNELTIPADSMQSTDTITVSVDTDNAAKALTVGDSYLAPVIISTVNGDGQPSSNAAIRYIAIKCVQSLINDGATEVIGTKLDANSFTCLSADGLDKDSYGFQGWQGWAFTKKQEKASFVVDFGETKKVTGFNVESELIKNANVSLSSDNNTWTELGNTSDHTAVGVRQGWQTNYVYVLYGAVPARYMKVEMDLDQDSWYWDYMEWGYCTLSGLSVYAE